MALLGTFCEHFLTYFVQAPYEENNIWFILELKNIKFGAGKLHKSDRADLGPINGP